MKRILYITRARLSFSRGHTINILKTAEAVANTKQYSDAVFSSAPEPFSHEKICGEKKVTYPVPLDVSSQKRSYLLYVWNNRDLFDVLYFRDPFLWHMAFLSRVFLRKRVVFEVHGSHEWVWGKPFWHMSVFFAHGLVFITKGLMEYYNPSKPCVVTHVNAVDMKEFEKNNVFSDKQRLDLGLPEGVSLIMYAGNFLWYSWDVLIRMMHLVPRPAMLILVGAKPEEKELMEEAARKEGLQDRVQVHTRVVPSLYPSYIQAADVLVNPLCISYPGSISSKIFEYMAAGKPIVSAKGKAMEEVLIHEKNALLVDLSAEQFGKAVVRILNDPYMAAELSKNARESARRFTWEARALDICSLLERI